MNTPAIQTSEPQAPQIDPSLDWHNPALVRYDNGDQVMVVISPAGIRHLHNHTGPAVIPAQGRLEWWLWGRKYPFESWVTLSEVSESQLTYLRIRYDTR